MSDKNRSQFSRETILEATLYVLLEEGIKGIKFQSVADRAGVYPSSISYHFKTIENLIESSFHFYLDHYNREVSNFRLESKKLIEEFSSSTSPGHTSKEQILEQYSQVLTEIATPSDQQYVYLMELDRLFRNELNNYPPIAKKIAAQDSIDIELMESFFAIFGSPTAHQDAIHLMALLGYLNSQYLQFGASEEKQRESKKLILSLLQKSTA